jgi:hypothetical protein
VLDAFVIDRVALMIEVVPAITCGWTRDGDRISCAPSSNVLSGIDHAVPYRTAHGCLSGFDGDAYVVAHVATKLGGSIRLDRFIRSVDLIQRIFVLQVKIARSRVKLELGELTIFVRVERHDGCRRPCSQPQNAAIVELELCPPAVSPDFRPLPDG